MSLIVAFAGSREAIIGGDKRSITFLGSCPVLEEELYSGKIKDDEELLARAKELCASLQVSDDREKVWRHAKGDILVGEVTEISLDSDKRRRIYLAPGAYLMADIANREAKISGQGKVGCIVLGNKLTQRLASDMIRKVGGRMNEEIMRSIFADVGSGSRTASVSKEYTVLRTEVKLSDPAAALLDAFKEDCRNSGWRLCGQQPCSQQPCDRQ